jgi:macrolide transport system ATP-binding/permease protein
MQSRWIEKLTHRMRSLFHREDADYELSDELRFHVDQKTRTLVESGLSREEARRLALLEFRGVERTKEECRDARGTRWLEDLAHDLTFSLRQLRKTPGFAAIAILTLALGIGANAAIFSLVHAFLLKNLPVADPQTLVRLGDTDDCCINGGVPDNVDYSLFSTDEYERFRKDVPEFQDLAAMQAGYRYRPVTARRAGTQDAAASIVTQFVSGNYFRTFGLTPAAGRLFRDDDDVKGAPITAVMSYALWQSRYGGDASIIGSTFYVDTQPVTVVGVAPRGFYGDRLTDTPPQLYIPLRSLQALTPAPFLERTDIGWLYIIGRIKPGVAQFALQAEVSTILKQTLADSKNYRDPAMKSKDTLEKAHVVLTPGGAGIMELQDVYKSNLRLLMIASGLVLLIACANIANLLLVRGMQRKTELSVRTALGAARSRLVRQLLTESVMLSILGGLAGLAIAYGGTRMLLTLAFPDAVNMPISPSPSPVVLAFAFGLSLLTGILFGMAPAWLAAKTDPADALRGSRNTARGVSPLQKALVVLQAALALVLLVGAGLFLESLGKLEGADLHLNAKNRYIVHIDPAGAGYATTDVGPLYRLIEERFHAIPGVKYVGISSYTPMEDNNWGNGVQVAGKPKTEDGGASLLRVSPEYFDSVGTKVLDGRGITAQDVPGAPTVAVVNQAFVKKFFKPGENPIGQHFGGSAESVNDNEIVGVVEDTVYTTVRWENHSMFFIAPTQEAASNKDPVSEDISLYAGAVVLATEAPMPEIESLTRQTLSSINPNLAVVKFETFSKQIADRTNEDRMISRLTLIFGGLSLLLAALGLYGVTSYTVARRTSEIGIRIALGARPSQVVSMVMRGAMVQTLIGLAIGIPVVLACARFVESQLFQIKGVDWRVLLAAVAALALASVLAGVIPARRAATTDPARTLTVE